MNYPIKYFLIIVSLCFISTILKAQADLEFSLGILEKYVGPSPELYENKKDSTFRFFLNEYNILEEYVLNSKIKLWEMKVDTISSEKPLSSILTDDDLPLKMSSFSSIKLDSSNIISSTKLFEKSFDFIGSNLNDKIEIHFSDDSKNAQNRHVLKIYENKNESLRLTESLYLSGTPLSLYQSKIRHLDMYPLILFVESDIPEESKKVHIVYNSKFVNK